MDLKLKLIIIFFSFCSIIFIISMLKKEKINMKYSLLWILTSIAICFLGIFPSFIDRLSLIIGIYEPINLLFFMGFIFILLMILSFVVLLSRISERQKDLAQYIAIIEYENIITKK